MAMRADLPNAVVLSVLGHFGQRTFSTDEFGDQVKAQFPADWATLESTYATGGKGAGAPYSAYSAVSTILRGWSKRGVVENLGLSRATFTFGAPRVLHWRVRQSSPDENFYPDEVTEEAAFHEGALLRVLVDRYERDEQARSKCIEHYGPICAACSFDFEARYGSRGAGFIHVHHLTPLSEVGEDFVVDPVKDLIPVCPNCHAIIHRGPEVLTIDEVKALLSERDSEIY